MTGACAQLELDLAADVGRGRGASGGACSYGNRELAPAEECLVLAGLTLPLPLAGAGRSRERRVISAGRSSWRQDRRKGRRHPPGAGHIVSTCRANSTRSSPSAWTQTIIFSDANARRKQIAQIAEDHRAQKCGVEFRLHRRRDRSDFAQCLKADLARRNGSSRDFCQRPPFQLLDKCSCRWPCSGS